MRRVIAWDKLQTLLLILLVLVNWRKFPGLKQPYLKLLAGSVAML